MKKQCDMQIKELRKEINSFQTQIQELLQEIPVILSVCIVCHNKDDCIDLPCQHSICRRCHGFVNAQCTICPQLVRNLSSSSSEEMV